MEKLDNWQKSYKNLGSLRYCGVPRQENAVEKGVNIAKSGPDKDELHALNVLNSELTSSPP